MGYKDDGYTHSCDICEKLVHSERNKLPDGWTLGHFKTLSGYVWEPNIYLCNTCWSGAKVVVAGPTFKKAWYKFNWALKKVGEL